MERVSDWLAVFLQDGKARGLSPKTLTFYREGVMAMVRTIEDKPVDRITTADLRLFLSRSHQAGRSGGGVLAHYRAVRVFLRWLVREEVIWDDPTRRLRPPKAPPPDLPVIREGEARRLLLAAEMGRYPLRDKALVLLLWDTAARAGEILELRLGDIRPEGVRVKRKGGAYQVLPISPATRRALWAYLRNERPQVDHDFAFVSEKGWPLCYNTFRQLLRRLFRNAGLVYKPSHAFRRGAAVAMVKNGMNPFALQTMMGHKSNLMTAHYVRLAEKDLREIHSKFSPVRGLFKGD
ncbi:MULTISPECIES: tyrosine-type recombinase/integrase [unclassified Meiothermus]|uniref:tyrosine-type recombinase/integrase n=1 Tax=unclassified Meiothermus TaxID=370471 RepID=UPI000D7CA982|nr:MULTISPECIES: tyrosine-type recombinase/integrase [unclassified Meiothermus]PZA07391.1 integrase [Meiothermus sp. Pnk-1]RYM38032.1 integrase [Meiothermus sp. PNK-Is4]